MELWGSSGASELLTRGKATAESMGCGATRTIRCEAPSSPNCKKLSWTTGSRPGRSCCTAIFIFPNKNAPASKMCQILKTSAGEGSDSARLMLLVSIAAARDRIRIANVYFIPDNLTIQTLLEALHRGVKVEIIAPGPDVDARIVRAVGKTRWKPLLQAGARFYEYEPARFHCKYLLVDDCWASFGSANLDNRSMSL